MERDAGDEDAEGVGADAADGAADAQWQRAALQHTVAELVWGVWSEGNEGSRRADMGFDAGELYSNSETETESEEEVVGIEGFSGVRIIPRNARSSSAK